MAYVIDTDFEGDYPPQGWTEQGTVANRLIGPIGPGGNGQAWLGSIKVDQYPKRPLPGVVLGYFPRWPRYRWRIYMPKTMKKGKWYNFFISATPRRTGHRHKGTRGWQRRYAHRI